jgi:L-threonylcarbamoyladenylate synthase
MDPADCNIVSSTEVSVVSQAVETLRRDGIVALPTETVYGLGASIISSRAIERVYSTKGRPLGHPLIVHIADPQDITRYGQDLTDHALTCARHFWPGPLTILVQRTDAVPDSVVGGSRLVGVRLPANEVTRSVIRNLGQAIVAPSANRFGHVSPTTAEHVCDDLGDSVDLIIDDGPCAIGVESTIIDCSRERPVLLRSGGLDLEDIELVLETTVTTDSGPARAPGMLTVHYQPHAEVILARDVDDASSQMNAVTSSGRSAFMLKHHDQLPLYASTLYAQMRQADRESFDRIVAILPEERGLGRAIRDRLSRAAAR